MEKTLLIQAWLLDDRYHGNGDWPPSPARLFQAMVAGNAIGAELPADCADTLRWLEALPPPEIRSQRGRLGSSYTTFVPNNDLDAKGGDPARVVDIRVSKSIQPRHINACLPIVYAWKFAATDSAEAAAERVCAMAENIYQLGRGVDMAWAQAVVLDDEAVEQILDTMPGDIFRPGSGQGEIALNCPQPGSLDSLLSRYQANRVRLKSIKDGRKVKVYFTNPPKAELKRVNYNPAERWRLFELRSQNANATFYLWSQHRAVALVEQVRDKIANHLAEALPDQTATIERIIIGRNASEGDKARRIQLIPIPSIGHTQANRSIRRLLLKVPADCPVDVGDIEWALSGLVISEHDTDRVTLIPAEDVGMLRHYALESGDSYRVWHSVTPVVLPLAAARRRIDPRHCKEEAKPGTERADEEQRACAAVLQALRHAGLRMRVEAVRVQREPFSRRGVRAEDFARDTRFAKERLWHVELRFAEPAEGLIVIGDGRYVGLGLMAPDKDAVSGVWAYDIVDGLKGNTSPELLTRSLRRAVMAKIQMQIGARRTLPGYFTGHAPDGSALRRGSHEHLAFAFDPEQKRFYVIAPHLLESRTAYRREKDYLEQLDLALRDFAQLRAGPAGLLRLAQVSSTIAESQLLTRARRWETVTPYKLTRHAKRLSPSEALCKDVLAEIRRLQLPIPDVEVLSVDQGPKGGIEGHLRLEFPQTQPGPILIGRTRHFGGGLFMPV